MISAHLHAILNLSLALGAPLLFSLHQLYVLRSLRSRRNGGSGLRRPQPSPTPPNDDAGLPPLPACLIPEPAVGRGASGPRTRRTLERV